jgi:hypothetical protein
MPSRHLPQASFQLDYAGEQLCLGSRQGNVRWHIRRNACFAQMFKTQPKIRRDPLVVITTRRTVVGLLLLSRSILCFE